MALPEQGMMRPVPLRARTSDLIITNLPGKYLDRSHLTGFIREINQTAPRQQPRLQLQVQTRPGPLPPGHQAAGPQARLRSGIFGQQAQGLYMGGIREHVKALH